MFVLRLMLVASLLIKTAFAAHTVDGHVVNSVTGIDVPDATVNLIRDGRVAYSATTDAEGRFRIERVEAGSYSAHYNARGFWPIPNFLVDEDFERQCGNCFLKERGRQTFQVNAAGDPVLLEMKMPPLAKISGRVLDRDGEPVANANVRLQWGENWLCRLPSCSGVARETRTNNKGEYSVPDVDVPGVWLLSATAPSSFKPPESSSDQRLAWAQTFYPNVIDPELSVRVIVRFGVELTNLDIKLATTPVYRVRGVVFDTHDKPISNAKVVLRRKVGSSDLVQQTTNEGVVDFQDVAQGEWQVYTRMDQRGIQL